MDRFISRPTCVAWPRTFWLGSAAIGGARGRKQRKLESRDWEAGRRLGCFLVKSCGGVRPNSTICTRSASRMTGSFSWDSTFKALQRYKNTNSISDGLVCHFLTVYLLTVHKIGQGSLLATHLAQRRHVIFVSHRGLTLSKGMLLYG